MIKNYKELLRHVTTMIFDYDGVFTDGKIILTESGEQLRTGNVKDGYALQLAVRKGYRIAVISGGTSQAIIHRMNSLNIYDVFIRVDHKIKVYREYLQKHGLRKEEVLFMGDDIPDLQIIEEAGVVTCPADAAEEVKSKAHYISHLKGGEGCVRDIVEQVLKVQGNWLNDDAFIW